MRHARLALALLLAGCSQAPSGERDSAGSQLATAFQNDLSALCVEVASAVSNAEAATSEAEFRQRSKELLAEQETFIEEAARLEPPGAHRAAFDRYLAAFRGLIGYSRESFTGAASTEESLQLELSAAETGVEAFEAKQHAELPDECPPPSAEDVNQFLFVARANVACYELGQELDELGGLRGPIEGGPELARFIQTFAVAPAEALREAAPPELDPTSERVISLFEERADALLDLAEAFEEKDRTRYNEANRRQERASRQAERLAQALGLTHCQGFIGVQAT